MVLLLFTPILKFLDVHALFYYILMSIPNLNLIHVVSLAIVLNIKVFVVGILSLNNYVSLAMSPFGNIVRFPVFLPFTHLYPAFNPSSLIPPLIYFPLMILSLTLKLTHYLSSSSITLTLSLTHYSSLSSIYLLPSMCSGSVICSKC